MFNARPITPPDRKSVALPFAITSVGSLALALLVSGCGSATVTPPPTPTVIPTATLDPRLILRAHTVTFSGALSGGARISGGIYPAFAYQRNTLHVTVRRADGTVVHGGHITLVVTMPGMHMIPVKATLQAVSQAYSGVIILPMFGRYHIQTVVTSPSGRYSGAVALLLPI